MSDSSELYYVVLRGSGRQPIFQDDADRRHFKRALAECAAACRVTVHAYCLLETEARLAVRMGDVPISQFAQRVAGQHAHWLEREIALTGSHFEQKYRGVRVDGQTELRDLVRHIHLAPLKAGLASDLLAYEWCSHRVYMGLEAASWVTIDETLRSFARSRREARRGYAEFMTQGGDRADPVAVRPVPEIEAAETGLRKK